MVSTTQASQCTLISQLDAGFLCSSLLLAMAVIIALIVFLILRGPARELLSMNSRLTAAKSFFSRTLFVLLILVCLAVVAGKNISMPGNPNPAFMEYVWRAAGFLGEIFGYICVVVGGYAILIVMLLLGLGRYHDQ